MKYCSQCGAKVDGESKFCDRCGAALADLRATPVSDSVSAERVIVTPEADAPPRQPEELTRQRASFATRRPRLAIALVACAALSVVSMGWLIWANRPMSRQDIPNVVSVLGVDEKGVDSMLLARGARRAARKTGGQMATFDRRVVAEVDYELPRLNTWKRRPEAADFRRRMDEALAPVLGHEQPPTTTDARVAVFFDSSGKCCGVDLSVSGLAARTVLGQGAQVRDVAMAAGLPSNAAQTAAPSWASSFGGTSYFSEFAAAGENRSLLGMWNPVGYAIGSADGSPGPLDPSVDAGDVTLRFTPAISFGASAPTANAVELGSPPLGASPEDVPVDGASGSSAARGASGGSLVRVPDILVSVRGHTFANTYEDDPTAMVDELENYVTEELRTYGLTGQVNLQSVTTPDSQEPTAGTMVPAGTTVRVNIGFGD
jgi:hypothetical protein